MSKRFIFIIILVASATLLGLPHESVGQELISSYAGAGMAEASGDLYTLSGTAGQAAAGRSGTDPLIRAGFWNAARSAVSVGSESIPGAADLLHELAMDDPFPNPVSTEVSIEYETPQRSSGVDVSVFDVTGRRVLSVTPADTGPGRQSITFDTSHLAPGLYFIRLTLDAHQVSSKMIVAR